MIVSFARREISGYCILSALTSRRLLEPKGSVQLQSAVQSKYSLHCHRMQFFQNRTDGHHSMEIEPRNHRNHWRRYQIVSPEARQHNGRLLSDVKTYRQHSMESARSEIQPTLPAETERTLV